MNRARTVPQLASVKGAAETLQLNRYWINQLDTEIKQLCSSMRQWDVAKDQTLFTEGEPAASCFVMARGLVEVKGRGTVEAWILRV